MINKITLKNSVKIVNNSYVIKKKSKEMDSLYNYLLSRSFDYFPKIIKEDDNNIYYEYISDVSEPREQKIIDMVRILTLLHSKTTFYKEMDIDNYKYIYESINQNIDDTYRYYNALMDNIDKEVYMSPANYLIARNISLIYSSLNYSKENIAKWYKIIDNKRKTRLTLVHNNLSLEHYLKDTKSYLISWDKAKIDMPIIDLISLYKNHYLEFDFVSIMSFYLSKYPLNKEEMILFLTMISIPSKIKYTDSEYKNVLCVRNIIDYVYKTRELVAKYGVKDETNKP